MIKGKPDVTAFLDGGAAAAAEVKPTPVIRKAKPAAVPGPAGPKRQKLVELPAATFDALKIRAFREYEKTGRRVTETEIIIAALNAYLGVTG